MQGEETDHMDELIRAASESYHPTYDDKAWDKMEALLNKHLPEKEDHRKPVAIILLLLLSLGATFFAFRYSWNQKTTEPAAEISNMHTARAPLKRKALTQETSPVFQDEGKARGTTIQPFAKTVDPTEPESPAPTTQLSRSRAVNKNEAGFAIDRKPAAMGDLAPTGELRSKQNGEFQHPEKALLSASGGGVATTPGTDTTSQKLNNNRSRINSAMVSAMEAQQKAGKKAKSKTGERFTKNFTITFSAGPDISFVGFNSPGKTNLSYGAGLSYTLAKKFSVRSGFYQSTKVYAAAPGDYHPPTSYWTNNINLQRVDANCKVYEIPLSLAYSFGKSDNHNWFAAAGLSSYLMKSETYNYLYKNQQGQTMYKGWTLKNKNKHFFSVVTLSGGYQYKVSPRFSIAAEPYLKIPLQGIGFGKIKLNSGGLLITAGIRPFVNKK